MEMRCRSCGYDLRGLEEHRCPECGRGFDPGDALTYLAKVVVGRRLLVSASLAFGALCAPWFAFWILDALGFVGWTHKTRSWQFYESLVGMIAVVFGLLMSVSVFHQCWHALRARDSWIDNRWAFVAAMIISGVLLFGLGSAVLLVILSHARLPWAT